MKKFAYLTITTGLVLGAAMVARTIPTAASLPAAQTSPTVDIQALHSNLNVRALPNGDVDEGNSD